MATHNILPRPCPVTATLRIIVAIPVICLASGCASFSFPAEGIPVYRLPEELLARSQDRDLTIDLTSLGQAQPKKYLLADGDTLGVWISGVTGPADQATPVNYASQSIDPNLPPSVGLPLPVLADGTVDLPIVGPVDVDNMDLVEAKQAIRNAYRDQGILQAGLDRVIVTLVKPRSHQVLVFRQEATVNSTTFSITTDTTELNRFKRGSGYQVVLPAYNNDVLRALSLTGGLPGIDAANAVIIFRGAIRRPEDASVIQEQLESGQSPEFLNSTGTTYIPLRTPDGQRPPFNPEDVILQTGDVVFVEARISEIFFTAGLLPTGATPLPRDYDLDIVEAIALAGGTLYSGGLTSGLNSFNSEFNSGRIGGPSPSRALVLRRLPDGDQIPIRVDLDKALTDASERLVILPNDTIILKQSPDEAISRYVASTLRLDFIWRMFTRGDGQGVTSLTLP